MQFETLYKKNVSGSIQSWTVSVDSNIVTTTYGQLDGKLQSTEDVIREGKNIGKSNETTPEEQAQLKAQQIYDKKLKQGYTPDLELAKSSDNVLDAVNPMLAHPIEKKEKYVKFPAVAQPKLDGMRCIAIVEDGKCQLFSRTQKEVNTLPHIVVQIEKLFEGESIILDGELYNHEHKENFNRLMSLIKRDEVHPDCQEIQYHIYDVVDSKQKYYPRFMHLEPLLEEASHLFFVPTVLVKSREMLENAFHAFLELGYEGAMYRNPEMTYEHKRSAGLLKVKVMQDAEYPIIGVLEGNGKLAGHAGSFICTTPEGKEFKAKLKGELDSLIEYFENFDKYKGKSLTVQYQGLTPDGIPRFPVGLRIREAE